MHRYDFRLRKYMVGNALRMAVSAEELNAVFGDIDELLKHALHDWKVEVPELKHMRASAEKRLSALSDVPYLAEWHD